MSDRKEQLLCLVNKHPDITKAGLSLATGLLRSDIEELLVALHCDEDIVYKNEEITLRRTKFAQVEPHSISELDFLVHAFLQSSPGAVLGDIAVALEISKEQALILLTSHEARSLLSVQAGSYNSCVEIPIHKLHIQRDPKILSLETQQEYQGRQRRENLIAAGLAFVILVLLYFFPRHADIIAKADMLTHYAGIEEVTEVEGVEGIEALRKQQQKVMHTKGEQQAELCMQHWKEDKAQSCAIMGVLYTQDSWIAKGKSKHE